MSHSERHMPVAFEHVIIALALHQVPMLHGLLSWVADKQLGHISWHIHEIRKSDSTEPKIQARTAWNSSCGPHHLVAKLLVMKWTSGMPRLIGVNREEQSTESWFSDYRF